MIKEDLGATVMIIMLALGLFVLHYIADRAREENEQLNASMIEANEPYINAMIEADNAYRAAINEPKQCKQTLEVCWQFLNHKLVTVK